VSLASELLSGWAPIMKTVELRSGNTGRFEVTLDGELVFSKAQLHRHPKPGEVAAEFERRLGRPLAWRKP
jgi:selT/selW/selH-like putative selenoprotein